MKRKADELESGKAPQGRASPRKADELENEIKELMAKRARLQKAWDKLDARLIRKEAEWKKGSKQNDMEDYWDELIDAFFWAKDYGGSSLVEEVEWINEQRKKKELKTVPKTQYHFGSQAVLGRDVTYTTKDNVTVEVYWSDITQVKWIKREDGKELSGDDVAYAMDHSHSWKQVIRRIPAAQFHLALLVARHHAILFEQCECAASIALDHRGGRKSPEGSFSA
jgi:hypothetical protein